MNQGCIKGGLDPVRVLGYDEGEKRGKQANEGDGECEGERAGVAKM
jgi:hypothetical protein